MLILFLACAVLFTALAIWRLERALSLLLLCLPLYLWRISLFGIPLTMLEAFILIVAGVWLWREKPQKWLIKKQKGRKRYPFDIEIALVMILAFVAAGVAGFNNSALGVFKAYFFEPILLFVVVFNVFGPKKNYFGIVWPLVLSGLVVSLLALYQAIFNFSFLNPIFGVGDFPRAVSFYGYPNAVGLYVAPLVPLAGALVFKYWTQKKYELAGLAGVSGLAMIGATVVAKSEGALIGLVLAAVVSLGMMGYKKIVVGLLLMTVLMIMAIVPLRDYALEKVQLRDLSGEIRKQHWRETGKMLSGGYWLLGSGLSNYTKAVAPWHQAGIFFNFEKDPDFRRKIVIFDNSYKQAHWQPVEIYMYPHNIFLNFWVEVGFLGMLLFTWIIGKYLTLTSALIKMAGADNLWAVALMGAMVVIVVHGLVDVPYFKNDLSVMFWVLIAMVGIGEIGNVKFLISNVKLK